MRQLRETKPSTHGFVTGSAVRLSKRYPPRKAAPGQYKVVAQLPERDGQLQYRIKSSCEPFYRTVAESELESDAEETAPSHSGAGSPASPRLGTDDSTDLRSSKIGTDF